ncbi:hypothetical protein [Haloprofundus salilacus]|uniref:VNG_1110C family protein n=1 Tax=Haloprofundus salilacus TaxID=2876190 RepID=UPI001CCD125B|nr:hypothetical protein [Haloprofundus salilacus]
MPNPEKLRDSTQIVLPCTSLDGLREELESQFTVTVFSRENARCRIIGSPVEIKAASEFLGRHGIRLR